MRGRDHTVLGEAPVTPTNCAIRSSCSDMIEIRTTIRCGAGLHSGIEVGWKG